MTALDVLETEILARVSQERTRTGLSPLLPDALLSQVARDYSRRMAAQEFFSHTCHEPGLATPDDRVRASGGDYPGIGENIAMHDAARASAAQFVDGWMKSQGHRANILTADWEVSGVGIHADARGQVFATQLFGIAPKVLLDAPTIEATPASWYMVRVVAKVGRAHSLAVFVRNRFAGSADADRDGTVTLEVELPAEPGRHHIGFGRKHRDKGDGWIGVYEGTAEIGLADAAIWHQGPPAHSGCTVLEQAMYRVTGAELVTGISGRALVPAICVVDGKRHADLIPGDSFGEKLRFRSGSGIRRIDIGLPGVDDRYLVYRSFEVDTDAGSITTRS